jgi:transcriptional regulator with XRE-family HTH domain
MQMTDALAVREAVAGAVRAELARRRLTQTDLAAALGLSQQAASRRLAGKVPFDIDELSRVADLLRVRLVDLLPAERVSA